MEHHDPAGRTPDPERGTPDPERGRPDPAREACERAKQLFERLIEGDPDVVEIGALKGELENHIASCKGCRDLYALDLALIESIKTAPAIAFESVASEVVGRVSVRERRFSLVRWGALAGAVCAVGIMTAVFGLGIYSKLWDLVRGGLGSSPVLEGVSRTATAFLRLGEVAKSLAFGGALGSGAAAYAPQAAMLIIAMSAFVLLMMYGMGIWLRKPREVRSWHRS
jgi:hypothetical protein